jgi:hypothetical protein
MGGSLLLGLPRRSRTNDASGRFGDCIDGSWIHSKLLSMSEMHEAFLSLGLDFKTICRTSVRSLWFAPV